MNPKVDLVYFNAGGGHRAAALALQAQLQRQQPHWQVQLVNLTEVLDRQGQFKRLTGLAPEDLYNRRLRRGWTIGLTPELRLLQALIRLAHGPLTRVLQQHWAATEPDLVVSLIPNFNRALGESLAQTLPGVPFATVMTDLADLPPHFWAEPSVPQHLVCGTPQALQQALAGGVPRERLSLVSGMLLRPSFYEPPALDRAAARQALGLDPDLPTAAVMDGGQGSARMLRIARELPRLQLVLLAGHDAALARRLRQLRRPAAQAVLGFTPDVAAALRAADFFIGKPGPGALSEALHLGLPVITFDNAWTLPQERFNAGWVRALGVGLALRSLAELPEGVAALLPRLHAFQSRVRWLDNRALFEVPAILAELLQRTATAAAPPALSRRDEAAAEAARC
ncbi:MAG: galactosyldiacylglycerol synthase [Rubrivivax sp.]